MEDVIDWSKYAGRADPDILEQEYKDWCDNADFEEIDEAQLKRDLFEELRMLKKMSSKE